MIPKKIFYSILTIYVTLGLYIFFTSFQSPIVGIFVKEENEKWTITNFEFPQLSKVHEIYVGDYIVKVNDIHIDDYEHLQYDKMIRSANSLTIESREGEIRDVLIKHSHLPFPFLYYFLLPLGYFLITMILAIYLYNKKQGHDKSLNYLILFILSIALTYGSIAGTARLNHVGVIAVSTCMILTLVLLIQFLKSYFEHIQVKWYFIKNLKLFYMLPIIVFICSILEIFIPSIYSINTIIILGMFLLLLVCILIVIVVTYIKTRERKIQILFWGILLPFFPFLFLYVVPEILFQQYFLSATISVLFLLLIPISFIFTQLNQRLFDIEYEISRFRYFFLISLFLTIVIAIVIQGITSISMEDNSKISLIILLTLLLFSYIKETLDYYYRKVLFTPKRDYIHLLYSTIELIGDTLNREELYEHLTNTIRKKLELSNVSVIEFDVENETIGKLYGESDLTLISNSSLQSIKLGEIKRIKQKYIACIHKDVKRKQILILENKGKFYLKHGELLWIELIILYVNSFIDNLKLVEDLLAELKIAKQKGNHPVWLKKLVWLQIEDERKQLAQELHDTILQEQLFLIREMDTLLHENDGNKLQTQISSIHRQLIEMNHQLRVYCEQLKPPLLDTLGLKAALNKLFMQTKKRASFTLIYTIDTVETLDNEINLLIYRIIQEMLSNALKHSEATYVKIQLTTVENGFKIFYMDNGVGFDVENIQSTSMGLNGMRERVLAFNGDIEIDSYPNEGMQIRVKIEEGFADD